MENIGIIFPGIMMILLGIAMGMYISSQILESINCKKRYKEFIKNMENYGKEKETKQ